MVRISGKTRLAGVIGWPVDHSLSPAMHNAAYEALNLNWVYVPMPVPDEIGLRRVVAAIRSLPFVGFNVTMPYKADVLELCDEVAMAASMAGAVNTVHCVDGKLIGYNTDGRGLLESLSADAGFDPADKNVVLIGAGGAAGSALVAFILGRVATVTIVNRDVQRAEDMITRVEPHLKSTRALAVNIEAAEPYVASADLIVNATPLGMNAGDPSPLPTEWLNPGHVVLDMVYGGSAPTALVSAASECGATGLDGLGMLVNQGATAVDIWNDGSQVRTPRDVMRAAAVAQITARAAHGADDR